ncbi:MAG: hypothetical protein ACYC64_17310 [Armatimonadota bacterium]
MSDGEWSRVTDAFSEQAIFAARLLAGEMPEDIEQVFQERQTISASRQAKGFGDGLLMSGLVESM